MKDLDEKRALGERMGIEDNGERGIGRAPGDRLWAPGRVGGGYGIALETSAAERCTKKATGVGSQELDQGRGLPSCNPHTKKRMIQVFRTLPSISPPPRGPMRCVTKPWCY